MEIIDGKKYYDSKDFRAKISGLIMKHSKDLEKEIKIESKFRNINKVVYV